MVQFYFKRIKLFVEIPPCFDYEKWGVYNSNSSVFCSTTVVSITFLGT
ncbi:hypothetical protein SAMN04488062_10886 [Flavobacterium omnivorum]|uniref:Uncharacterized protein n=1 Tax=Flavobacterium omnivorum TaxID=178355 RepID=A0A1G8CU40_9FLAO|nr:hypothetical protein SAMN04488062_10886 [Flavobacterium omnivorum]